MIKTICSLFIAFALVLVVPHDAKAQATPTQTTFSAAVPAPSPNSSSPVQTVCLTSSTGVSAPATANTMLLVGREIMFVNATTPNANCWSVTRGYDGTRPAPHSTSEIVWVGPPGGTLSSPFISNAPASGAGGVCTATALPYNPLIVSGAAEYVLVIGEVWYCPATGLNASTWVVSHPTMQPQYGPYYIGIEGGANNAITGTYPGLTLTAGNCVQIQLAHTLQAGANTFALNGGSAKSILSHFNTSNNLGTAYAATGVWAGCYNGTAWLDSSE